MTLTDDQTDDLAELLNIGFFRAAAALSDLVHQRVVLHKPRISVSPIDQIPVVLGPLIENDVATVHQIFNGPVAGDAMLLLDERMAAELVSLLTEGGAALAGRVDESAREVLMEIGNILLSSCLGVFGNMLNVAVSFSVPRLQLASLEGLLSSLMIGKKEMQYALLMATEFETEVRPVSGYLMIILGVSSLETLMLRLRALVQQPAGETR